MIIRHAVCSDLEGTSRGKQIGFLQGVGICCRKLSSAGLCGFCPVELLLRTNSCMTCLPHRPLPCILLNGVSHALMLSLTGTLCQWRCMDLGRCLLSYLSGVLWGCLVTACGDTAEFSWLQGTFDPPNAYQPDLERTNFTCKQLAELSSYTRYAPILLSRI